MSNTSLFALARADNAIILTPQRNLSEFDFPQIEAEAAEIRGQISKDGGPIVVCDFSKMDYCGSTALGFFTRLLKDTRSRGGEMVFCNVSPAEKEVLNVTRLDTLWPVCDSLEEALQTATASACGTSCDTWVVVADRAIARFFEHHDGPAGGLRSVATLRHRESRKRMSETVTDGPGSFRGGAIVGSESGEPNQDHRHCTATIFAREVVAKLEAGRQRGDFQHVILVAAPLFLGTLREAMSAPLRKLVELEIDKDYTHLDACRILAHLNESTTTA